MFNLSDPTDLEGLRRALAALDGESQLSPLGMQQVVISEDAHLHVKAAVRSLIAPLASVIILADTSPIARGGQNLCALVEHQLKDDFSVRIVRLDDGHRQLHADDRVLDMATEAVKGADAVVTVGSGTMTDIGKIATLRNGNIPQVVVQTAASVDGFTDNVSVILRNGVKRTVPSRWPNIVLADTTTIGEAPREMNTAGFGEAISLFTAPADWYLSSLVGLDNTFQPASMAMLNAAASVPPDWSHGIAKGEASATRELTRLLALRGIVSGISDTTACLSGVEHVISHMLDLHHAASHKPIGLHGAQVGVASLVAAKLWRHAIDCDLIKPELLKKPNLNKLEQRIRSAFGHLGKDGAIASECWRDCQAKHMKIAENWEQFVSVVANWKQHAIEFDKMVLPAATLHSALQASGAPSTFEALNPSVSPELARWAVTNCFLMRSRFNLVDLLDMLGLWTEERITWALQDTLLRKAA
jgi:glycerol-1-phosphate dehydrogenase [NAD(P)+]